MPKRGDTTPWTLTATDGSTTPPIPVDLTTAQSVRLLASRDGQTVIDKPVTGNASGVVVYPPTAPEVAVAGLVRLELQVTWPDGTVQTFPGDGFKTIYLEPDIPSI